MSETATAPDATYNAQKSMDEIVALCKRRGFVYPASEIYGGINGFWDYGPLGVQLKNNIRDSWWRAMVECPPIGPDGDPLQIVGLDSAIVQNPKAWVASGHVGGFNDPMADCKACKSRFRADHLLALELIFPESDQHFLICGIGEPEEIIEKNKKRIDKLSKGQAGQGFTLSGFNEYTKLNESGRSEFVCPECGEKGSLTEPREFNLMFETFVGAIRDDDAKAYLRPETAQGIFLNYKNVLDTMRVRVPFGVAQVGKAFRNEVTPRNFVFRSREFEQMEMEFFCHPDDAGQWKEYWKEKRMEWYRSLGLSADNLIFREHDKDELSHYAKDGYGTVDIEYKWPFTAPGYGELEGIAHRCDFDLNAHSKANNPDSNADLSYFDQELQVRLQNEGVEKDEIKRRSRYIPHVIEPAAGLTRATLAVICEAFTPTPERKGSKYILKFAPHLAPIKAGIYPLVNKDGLPEVAKKLYLDLRNKFTCEYDAKQAIGKRYARMDEIGTPYCFTVDSDTLSDNTVTVRERDTGEQSRIAIDEVERFLSEKIGR